MDNLPETLSSLVASWNATVRRPRARALLAAVVLFFVIALVGARAGTTRARALAAGSMVAAVALAVTVAHRARRRLSTPAGVIRALAHPADPERSDRALRALSLLESRDPGTSSELARLHVTRALSDLPRELIRRSAVKLAFHYGVATLALGGLTAGACAVNGWGVVEGADVLLARRGIAPLQMNWLDDVELSSRPPDYLHESEESRLPFFELSASRGTLLTMRGVPTRRDRRLFLTDGTRDIPFVDDGTGRVVARWPLAESAELRVVARFGEVVIREPRATMIESIADESPQVRVSDAPRTVVIAEAGDLSDIPVRYEVTDDHGLREVHLVLRAGSREERRVLARLDGETRHDRGGHTLRTTDPFIRKSYVPVEVRVEAKDNDAVTGPKWGRSEAILLVPPDVGEPQALRLEALYGLRDRYVDALARRLERVPRGDAAARKAMAVEEARNVEGDRDALYELVGRSYAGVRFAGRIGAILRGQMGKLSAAMKRELADPTKVNHDALVTATERLVLVVDAVIHGLGQRDTKEASRRLADVADDLAFGISQIEPPNRSSTDRGGARADAAHKVLDAGSRSLKRLGALGRDIGEIVETDLLRVARARGQRDFPHGELAARDLANRLRQPDPSFGAKSSSGHGGGESGGGRGAPGSEDEPSDAENAFAEASGELDRLVRDHAKGMGDVDRAMAEGANEEDLKAMGEEAKRHADAVRRIVGELPSIGAGSDSWTSKGAAGRELGEQMARSLEQLEPADAVASGRSAMAALEEAKRVARGNRWFDLGDDRQVEERLDDVRRRLDPEVRWAEQELDRMKRRAAERAAGQLSKAGDEEQNIADRADRLASEGRGEGAFPERAIDAMERASSAAREAARALRQGAAEKGQELQRQAQSQLEMAQQELGGDGDERPDGDGSDQGISNGPTEIPTADQHKGPEEFRRRVVEGLGQPASNRHKDAVRRYAEGLLR